MSPGLLALLAFTPILMASILTLTEPICRACPTR
jgi:hypothetical protein